MQRQLVIHEEVVFCCYKGLDVNSIYTAHNLGRESEVLDISQKLKYSEK